MINIFSYRENKTYEAMQFIKESTKAEWYKLIGGKTLIIAKSAKTSESTKDSIKLKHWFEPQPQ